VIITPSGAACGNGECQEGETCESCSEDCGECPEETDKTWLDLTVMFTGLQGAGILGLAALIIILLLLLLAGRRKKKK
jgi:hypothetical protein